MCKKLTYDQIKADFESLVKFEETSYTRSYPHFLKYFEAIDVICIHHLIIASHFVYGWMPTIISLNLDRAEEVLHVLNAAKNGARLGEDELMLVKQCLNNSMVGASKLLHFINPAMYAIWDSRIFHYLTNKSSLYGIDRPTEYLEYLKLLENIKLHEDYLTLHSRIEAMLTLKVTHMRAIEMIMFVKGKRPLKFD